MNIDRAEELTRKARQLADWIIGEHVYAAPVLPAALRATAVRTGGQQHE